MIYSVDVRIEVPVHDTGVTDRIGDAVRNILPGIEPDREPGQLVGEVHEPECFSERLHEQAILDTARRRFAKHRDDDDFSFALKKQAMFRDVVSLSIDDPDELGDIEMHVTVRDPFVDEVIDYVTPPTEEGRSIDPNDR